MTGKEHSLDIARTLLRVAESATDQLIAYRLKAIALNYERRAEEPNSADDAQPHLHAAPAVAAR